MVASSFKAPASSLHSLPLSNSFISSPLSSKRAKMLSSLFSFINEISSFEGGMKTRKTKAVICKNEFDQIPLTDKGNTKPKISDKGNTKPKKRVSFDMKPLLEAEKCEKNFHVKSNGNPALADHQKAAVKVKILMTKEEASRLLSKCKDGGSLEFKDVAHELLQIPVNRVNLVSSGNQIDCFIKSIDKEL